METPRIRIDEVDDICVLICYLIYSLGCPLSKEQLIEITSLEDAVNYFTLSQAIEKVSGHLCDETDIDGEIFYNNTPKGIKAAKDLGATLPLSVRDKMFSEAVRIYTRDAMKKKGSFLAVHYIRNADSCTVGITIMDETTARQKYYTAVTVENEEAADRIKRKIKSDPKAFAEHLDKFFQCTD
ncbi:MAG: DUF4364 family protein [Ruminococcaceae bacterium]|nr:DUF4364 family protein [Oscillospiraceae bacterium]